MTPATITAIGALVVSVASLATSFYFGWCTRDHNRRSVKPLPFVLQSDFEDRITVAVRNNGSGPLVLRRVVAHHTKEGHSDHLVDLIPAPPEGLYFTNFNRVEQPRAVLPGEWVDILDLEINMYDRHEAPYRDVLRELLGNIRLEVDYTDVYESKFPPYTVDMTWFHRHHA